MSQLFTLLNTLTDEELVSLTDEEIVEMLNHQDEE